MYIAGLVTMRQTCIMHRACYVKLSGATVKTISGLQENKSSKSSISIWAAMLSQSIQVLGVGLCENEVVICIWTW